MNANSVIVPPDFGEETDAFRQSPETIELLVKRRSLQADFLAEPGPSEEELSQILRIAARAPDHGRVVPFRFLVFRNEMRKRAGDILADAFLKVEPQASEERVDKERHRFLRAPIVVALISKLQPKHKIPVWEQTLTIGAVGQNMLIAANAHGFAAQWLTEWYAYDDTIKRGFRLTEGEDFAGFVYIGAAAQKPKERARPEMDAITRYFE
ncbi:MAG: nitroreductase [Pseudomonadota bacterium]